jgi:hypothetical protein
MPNLKILLALSLAITWSGAASPATAPAMQPLNLLSVPNKVSAPFEQGKTNYVIVFGITNQTVQVKRIIAHQTTCGCTSLKATKTELGPGETGKIKIELHTLVPTAKAAYLIDESTNWYATQIEIVMPAPEGKATPKTSPKL